MKSKSDKLQGKVTSDMEKWQVTEKSDKWQVKVTSDREKWQRRAKMTSDKKNYKWQRKVTSDREKWQEKKSDKWKAKVTSDREKWQGGTHDRLVPDKRAEQRWFASMRVCWPRSRDIIFITATKLYSGEKPPNCTVSIKLLWTLYVLL